MSTTELRSRPAAPVRDTLPATSPSRPTRGARRRRAGWRRTVTPLALLVVWQLAGTLHLIAKDKLPPPTAVVSEAYKLTVHAQPAYGGTLQHALIVSLERWAIGFAVGGAVALVLAVIAGLSRAGEDGIDPILQMVRTLPLLGLIPVFIVWFGIGDLPKILLVALSAVVPLYLNAFSGIRSVDPRLLELARALHLSRREQLTHIVLPGALPQTLVGLRQSLGVSWLALVVAEQVNANTGLGNMIIQAENFNANDVIFVALITYTILGLLTDWIVRVMERRALGWREVGGVR